MGLTSGGALRVILFALPGLLGIQGILVQNEPRFRTTTYAGLFKVRVADKSGYVLGGLSKDDVVVLEDGEPRPIRLFEEMRSAPISLAILLDIGSQMSEQQILLGRKLVFSLIHDLDPQDEILLAVYGRDLHLLTGLTRDRTALVDALWNIAPGGRPGKWTKLARLFGSTSFTGSAVDAALHEMKGVQTAVKAVMVISAGFGNIGKATGDHLQLAGTSLFAVSMENKLGDAFSLGGDQIARRRIVERTGGFSYEAETVLERVETLRDTLKHYYLVAYELGLGDKPLEDRRVEFRVPSTPGCVIRAVRQSRSESSYY